MATKAKKYVIVYFGNEFFPCLGFVPYEMWDPNNRLELATNAELSLTGEACRQFLKETGCKPSDVNQKLVTVGKEQLDDLNRIINDNIYQLN